MRATESGVIINCEVKPKSKVFSLSWAGDILSISLTSIPIENRANREVIETVHKILRRPKNQVSILGGGKSRSKSVLVDGITEEEARSLLSQINE
ncbi:uncharacterized protein NEMAJ01_0003 [Nematocida major]|uniref:uncharacterized protein n=1 Tax=Nematocida major TaxID=1912982 RepID=UPI002008608A|nr:uncharacterized protein NEMAJ01_0003 [Nematocida major]KAH9385107.1 uncharacterized protein NEMAJ01_0003 [Nematocida major]